MSFFRDSGGIRFATVLKALGGIALAGALIGYFLFQGRFIIAGPQIELRNPNEVVQQEQVVAVIGTAKNITEITLNGRSIQTDESGSFAEQLVLPEGYTIMTIDARDRYGRTKTLTRDLVYAPARPETTTDELSAR
jgi:hypothetical protein